MYSVTLVNNKVMRQVKWPQHNYLKLEVHAHGDSLQNWNTVEIQAGSRRCCMVHCKAPDSPLYICHILYSYVWNCLHIFLPYIFVAIILDTIKHVTLKIILFFFSKLMAYFVISLIRLSSHVVEVVFSASITNSVRCDRRNR